jgi:two-component system, OmpR family, response regulator
MVSQQRSSVDRLTFDAIDADRSIVAFPTAVRADHLVSPSSGSRVQNGPQAVYVLVIDDNAAAQTVVVRYLEQYDMRVARASTRQEAVRQIISGEPSLIILNLQIGQQDGLELLRLIRSRSDVPVIVTGNDNDTEVDRVVGLELGADDYVAKPFGLREILARIRAILRRRDSARGVPKRDCEHGRYRFGGWQIDRRARRLTGPDGSPVALTKGEYALLTAFLDAPRRPLTRENLLHATRVHEDVFDRSIDIQIMRLRRKLRMDPGTPSMIRTERGVGYVLDMTVERIDGRLPQSVPTGGPQAASIASMAPLGAR